MKQILIAAFVLLLSILPAMAVEEHREEGTTDWNISATEGVNCISGLDLDNLASDHEVIIYFNNYGEQYVLSMVGIKSWGFWNYNISLTYPNGTTVSQYVKKWSPVYSTSDIRIQSYWTNTNSIINSVMNVDIYVGLLPLSASFGDIALPSYTDVPFSQVTGHSTVPGDLTVYITTFEEFNKQLQDDPLASLFEFGTDIFIWTWSKILGFIAKIPGVGPYMVSAISILSILVDDGFWWFNLLFIENPETTILTFEFFILSNAVLKTKRKSNVMALVNRIVSSHVALIEFFYNIFLGLINAVSTIINTIAAIVQGLKPL